jgi:hypothetical protein
MAGQPSVESLDASSSQTGGATAVHILTAHDVEQLTNVLHSWRRRYLIEIIHLLYHRVRVGLSASF